VKRSRKNEGGSEVGKQEVGRTRRGSRRIRNNKGGIIKMESSVFLGSLGFFGELGNLRDGIRDI
jgi:hypothetical protein